MEKFSLSRQFFKDVWLLTRSYWLSEKKKEGFFAAFLYCCFNFRDRLYAGSA